jgi:hypothetical protein
MNFGQVMLERNRQAQDLNVTIRVLEMHSQLALPGLGRWRPLEEPSHDHVNVADGFADCLEVRRR